MNEALRKKQETRNKKKTTADRRRQTAKTELFTSFPRSSVGTRKYANINIELFGEWKKGFLILVS